MIRNATHADIPRMVELGRLMFKTTAYVKYAFDDEKVTALCGHLIDSERGIALVIEHEGQIVGGLMASVYSMWFGDLLEASDFAVFIHPEFRGFSHAVRLIKEYVTQAKALGASRICLGNTTGYEPEKVKALYELAGFRTVGYCLEFSD